MNRTDHKNTKTQKQVKKKCFFVFVFLCFYMLAGCTRVQQASDQMTGIAALEQKLAADKALARIKCQELCQNSIVEGADLNSGPCLSNNLIPDWVCDVAHDPRQPIDDQPANQCSNFAAGKAHHFVEMDGNCQFIKYY